jgi:hypothetical protein
VILTSGVLSAGLAFDSGTGEISGASSAVLVSTVVIWASNTGGLCFCQLDLHSKSDISCVWNNWNSFD